MDNATTCQQTLVEGFFALIADKVHYENSSNNLLLERYRDTLEKIRRIEQIISTNDFFPAEHGPQELGALLPPLQKELEHLQMAIAGYKYWMDASFLSLTKKSTHLPLFMILDIDSDKGFRVAVSRNTLRENVASFTPDLPAVITDQFTETVETLASYAPWGNSTTSISATYSGIMPEEIRKNVKRAQLSGLFQYIFIVAEAPKWEISVVVHAKTDPLVIGVTKLGEIYLLGQYNPTDLEQLVCEKYTHET